MVRADNRVHFCLADSYAAVVVSEYVATPLELVDITFRHDSEAGPGWRDFQFARTVGRSERAQLHPILTPLNVKLTRFNSSSEVSWSLRYQTTKGA